MDVTNRYVHYKKRAQLKCNTITVLHFVHNYSGAAKYSEELVNQCIKDENLRICFVYVEHTDVDELLIEIRDEYTLVKFPPLFARTESEIMEQYISILSLYIAFADKVIVHENGNVKQVDFSKGRYSQFSYLLTLHFLPTTHKATNFGLFDGIICVTRYAANILHRQYGVERSRIWCVPNGIAAIDNNIKREDIRLRHNFAADDICILFIGRVEQSKGILDAISAIDFVIDKHPNVRLVIVGGGCVDNLLSRIKRNHSRYSVLGQLSNNEVHELITASDVGLIPSLFEQCSYVALEMMSHGLPIVATAVDGMRELFEDNGSALMVPVKNEGSDITIDEDMLKNQLLRLVDDMELRNQLGARAYQEWHEKYTAERMARETFEVYKELAAQF